MAYLPSRITLPPLWAVDPLLYDTHSSLSVQEGALSHQLQCPDIKHTVVACVRILRLHCRLGLGVVCVCGEGLVGLGGVTALHMQRKLCVIKEDWHCQPRGHVPIREHKTHLSLQRRTYNIFHSCIKACIHVYSKAVILLETLRTDKSRRLNCVRVCTKKPTLHFLSHSEHKLSYIHYSRNVRYIYGLQMVAGNRSQTQNTEDIKCHHKPPKQLQRSSAYLDNSIR